VRRILAFILVVIAVSPSVSAQPLVPGIRQTFVLPFSVRILPLEMDGNTSTQEMVLLYTTPKDQYGRSRLLATVGQLDSETPPDNSSSALCIEAPVSIFYDNFDIPGEPLQASLETWFGSRVLLVGMQGTWLAFTPQLVTCG
jgi:hypothetical protein